MTKDERIANLMQALEYIACPTMGYAGGVSVLEYIEKYATPDDIKGALLTCVDLAQRVKEAHAKA